MQIKNEGLCAQCHLVKRATETEQHQEKMKQGIINVNTMMPKYKEKLADDKRRMDEVKVKIETKTASAGDIV